MVDVYKIALAVAIIISLLMYWRLSKLEFYGRKILTFKTRISIALIFPLLLIFIIFFSSLILLFVIGAAILSLILFFLFLIFGRGKIYYKRF